MLPAATLYPLVQVWLQSLAVTSHATATTALAQLVTAALVAQSLTPAELMRALPSPRPVPARQRYKRVRRALDRPWLTPASLTPVLVRAVLALIAPSADGPLAGRTVVALDSVRLGKWDLFTLSVVWAGRAVPVGWAALPAPWPRGQFRPTVCRLVREVAAAWPAERPVVLVADRAFPSVDLFKTLRAARWDWAIRLTARHHVTVGGQTRPVRELLGDARPGAWTIRPGYFAGPAHRLAGRVVIGQGLVVLPAHQANPGSLRARERRLGQRRQHAASKNQSRTAEYDRWVTLFTSLPTVAAARAAYARRYRIEGSYRDLQTGWDGRHGWQAATPAARLATPAAVERLAGLWALATLLQCWVGFQTTRPEAPLLVHQTVAAWCTTGRLSLSTRGRLALTEPSGRLAAWLAAILADGAARIARGPLPAAALPDCPFSPSPAWLEEAA
jgi:hypothetical protein